MSEHHHNPPQPWNHIVSPLTQPFHNLSHHAWGLYLHRRRAPRRIGQVLRFPMGIHRHLFFAKVAGLKQKSRHRKSWILKSLFFAVLEDLRIMIDLNRPWKALTFNALIRKLIEKLWRPIKTPSFNDDYAMIMVCSLKRCLSFWYKDNLWASIGYCIYFSYGTHKMRLASLIQEIDNSLDQNTWCMML